MDRWRISYAVTPVKQVVPSGGYPSLGLRFRFEADALVGIDHDVSAPDAREAESISLPTVRALVELLEFLWSTPEHVKIASSETPTLLPKEDQ